MTLDIYINYPGHCEKAFQFYEKNLGGTIHSMLHHEQMPPHFPKEWGKAVMHAVMQIGNTIVRGADVPGAEPMRSAYLTLNIATADEAERIYSVLRDKGEVFMKMEKTFFANRFAMVRDQFGTSWMLINEK